MTFLLSCLPTDIDVDVKHGAKVGQRKRRRRRSRSPRSREFDRRRVVRHGLDALRGFTIANVRRNAVEMSFFGRKMGGGGSRGGGGSEHTGHNLQDGLFQIASQACHILVQVSRSLCVEASCDRQVFDKASLESEKPI